MTESFNYEEIELDKIKLRKMRIKIYHLEREFFKTKKYNVTEVKEKIRKIIEDEYRKKI